MVKAWSADRQEAAAEILEKLNLIATTPYQLSDVERADLEEALDETRRGEFASEAEVAALFSRYRV